MVILYLSSKFTNVWHNTRLFIVYSTIKFLVHLFVDKPTKYNTAFAVNFLYLQKTSPTEKTKTWKTRWNPLQACSVL